MDSTRQGSILRRPRIGFLRYIVLTIGLPLLILGALNPVNAQQSSIVVDQEFKSLQQGSTGIIALSGGSINSVTLSALDKTYSLFPTSTGFADLLAIPMTQKLGTYPVIMTINSSDGSSSVWQGTFSVVSGQFLAEPSFTMPADKMYLLDPKIQAAEDERLASIYGVVTHKGLWQGALARPVQGKAGSPFGTVRDYNDGSVRRHTGYDLVVPTGTPVLASGDGRVVYARPLSIHGNIVIIDHGWGLFTSYAHLSAFYVVPGQMVLQGDVIGLSGNTGRSTGPHVHWEIAVDGVQVNPISFLQLKLPN